MTNNLLLEEAIQDAESFGMEDIASLFRIGGLELINDLSKHNFELIPYFDNGCSQDAEEFYMSDACSEFNAYAISELNFLYNKLEQRNKVTVKRFLLSINEFSAKEKE